MNAIINLPDQEPDWETYRGTRGAAIRKIVLGLTPGEGGGDRKTSVIKAFPGDFASLFPHLTHLYLWGLQGLSALPALPPQLECLDVRGCEELTALAGLPVTLEILVLEGCPRLQNLPELVGPAWPKLKDLSLKGCGAIPESWVNQALAAAPELRRFDASACGQLTQVEGWPAGLERIELNQCAALAALPDRWPARLRRLGLRDAAALAQLPDFFDETRQRRLDETLDYLDLAGTSALPGLPSHWGRPRTLFLHGSGVRMPPVSEHGSHADENVAAGTRAYFEDVELTGQGEVKRCKLLFLGNGSAGKTCLSLALMPGGNPADAARLGSTDGVQFWDWNFKAKAGETMKPVHLHLWDFGGQEIYHNTHRLFMSAGAVFIVVWKPGQDGRQPAGSKNDYHDTWRPLQYWLDFIRLACPQKPRIAIVCSHHAMETAELKQQRQQQVREEFHASCPCFYVDSLNKAGELEKLRNWVKMAVGQVVLEQGVAVPAYWEMAQNLVEGWVRRMNTEANFAAAKNQIGFPEFQAELAEFIRASIKANDRYALIKEALSSGRFELDAERTRRTLLFLTHSGWLYWDKRLLDQRVIIGQKWALTGIYAVLERKPGSLVFRALIRSDGRFTLAQLGEWAWNEQRYSDEEQKLLLSFMQKCGLCFQLLRGAEAWRGEDVYVSFEHLPTAKELGLHRRFDQRLPGLKTERTVLKSPRMHRLHWQAFLTDTGAHYGKDAEYALDGFYLENQEGDKLLVLCDFDESGLGGSVEIQVGGVEPVERLKSATAQIQRFLPETAAGERAEPAQNLGQRSEQVEVFISYAWEPRSKAGRTAISKGCVEPVDAIEDFLEKQPGLKLIRDRNVVKSGDDLIVFMASAAKSPHVVVVHSCAYWKSPNCLFEMWSVKDELTKNTGKSLASVVIAVEHQSSGITLVKRRDEYIKYWESYDKTPPIPDLDPKMWIIRACETIVYCSTNFRVILDLNLQWSDSPKKNQEVLAAILARLKLPAARIPEGDEERGRKPGPGPG